MWKWLAKKKSDSKILLEKWTLVSKNPNDGKFDDLKSFKNQKLENHFKTGLEIIVLKSKGKSLRGWHMAQ